MVADPTKASALVSEDTAGSRGLESDIELIDEERQLLSSLKSHTPPAGSTAPRRAPPGYSDRHRLSTQHEVEGEDEEEEDDVDALHWDNTPRATSGKRDDAEGKYAQIGSNASTQAGLSKAERTRLYWRTAIINVIFILLWYTFSTLISVYNKWMFSPEHYGFPYPLFVTSIHMCIQFGLCSLVMAVVPSLRPKNRPALVDYGTKVVPCAVATGMDIGLSNLSLKTITLSFYTMCKSSTLGFVLLFAFLFRLEKPTWKLCAVIVIITAGVILMVSTETQFHLVGMIEVLTASALSGFRWALTQILLQSRKDSMGMGNPIATLFWLAPVMAVSLALCSIIFEGWGNIFGNEKFFGSTQLTFNTIGISIFPGILAFCMNVAEFGLIKRTSVVTLSVAGIFKETATIFLSTIIFGDELMPLNISGLIITIGGISLYNWIKYKAYDQKLATGEDASMTDRPNSRGHVALSQSSPEETLFLANRGEETIFSANRSAYDAPSAGAHTLGDDDSDDEAAHLHRAVREPEHPIPNLKEELERDPAIRRLDAAQAKLERSLDQGIHHEASDTTRSSDDEEWQMAWEGSGTKSTGNGIIDPQDESP
ncbi:uncharacterized protein L969DRAFT_88771 [Mixia osmundae IAM 14324]|uniref:Sugar phosphate transporter domain-containing protein n=1 Tax=Mixia osmundae (strain CBS 9802 / IAM 14324 / JCM 22182 / KY 12970) TaxID=764103 RepID=G7E0G8_MIXOS|nr:uncharacterized protein L969DRAFT_88771 [Mixia osmundae IAM 14324]KEI38337.1 hypothetical protein L969DRAFT_88771 [Mixia osmundae IAM 14324]GAA96328.1 hypothetical protein E5Q_02994 [Mixia osmundae IAM 14324]